LTVNNTQRLALSTLAFTKLYVIKKLQNNGLAN
jgi:hypothetical protein